jgi:dihydroneopterin aldolase/2-amino-4-hydroxy-6-hydroxymethyldihydropteridine diphosphokinase/dihydropteroate synthase
MLMHSRGEANANLDYSPDRPLEAVQAEIGEKVNCVVRGKGGVGRWLAIVNPSIEFSKAVEDNPSFCDTGPL